MRWETVIYFPAQLAQSHHITAHISISKITTEIEEASRAHQCCNKDWTNMKNDKLKVEIIILNAFCMIIHIKIVFYVPENTIFTSP